MTYHIILKEKIIRERKKGASLNEIHKKTGISKGTLSLWLKDIKLSHVAEMILLKKIKRGQYISAEKKKKKTRKILLNYFLEGKCLARSLKIDKNLCSVFTALLYWCEGGKNEKFGIHFTNSDPYLVKTFLYFLRRGYKLKENKLKVCIHLHEYHDVKKQLAFWSQTTKIPKGQFVKPYIKPHTGKVVRENYQGCISIRYYSTDLARKILMLGKACIHVFGGMV